MNPISVKIVFINIREKFSEKFAHTSVERADWIVQTGAPGSDRGCDLFSCGAISPRHSRWPACTFSSFQSGISLRHSCRPVCTFSTFQSMYNISTICAGAHFAECNISTIRAGLYIFLLVECRVHISTILSAISPTFARAHRVAIFRVGKPQSELNDISTPWLSCNDNGNEHLKDTLCSCLSIFSDFSVPYFQL